MVGIEVTMLSIFNSTIQLSRKKSDKNRPRAQWWQGTGEGEPRRSCKLCCGHGIGAALAGLRCGFETGRWFQALWVWSLLFWKSYLDLLWLIFFWDGVSVSFWTIWSCSLACEVGNRAQQVFCGDTNSSCGQQLSFPWRMDPAHDVDPRRMRNCAIFWLGRVLFVNFLVVSFVWQPASCGMTGHKWLFPLACSSWRRLGDGINWSIPFWAVPKSPKFYCYQNTNSSISITTEVVDLESVGETQRLGNRLLGQVGDRVWYGATFFFFGGGRGQR